jgi:transposase
MIMVLTLLIYAFAEWLLRKKLSETGMSVSNQIKKPTQKPTISYSGPLPKNGFNFYSR